MSFSGEFIKVHTAQRQGTGSAETGAMATDGRGAAAATAGAAVAAGLPSLPSIHTVTQEHKQTTT